MIIVKTEAVTYPHVFDSNRSGGISCQAGLFAIYKSDWDYLVDCVVKDPNPTDGYVDFSQLVTKARISVMNPSRDILEFVDSLGWHAPLAALQRKYGSTPSIEVVVPQVSEKSPERIELDKLREELFLNETVDQTEIRIAKEVKDLLRKARRLEAVDHRRETKIASDKSTWISVGGKK